MLWRFRRYNGVNRKQMIGKVIDNIWSAGERSRISGSPVSGATLLFIVWCATLFLPFIYTLPRHTDNWIVLLTASVIFASVPAVICRFRYGNAECKAVQRAEVNVNRSFISHLKILGIAGAVAAAELIALFILVNSRSL